jgi:hypothetical protein
MYSQRKYDNVELNLNAKPVSANILICLLVINEYNCLVNEIDFTNGEAPAN